MKALLKSRKGEGVIDMVGGAIVSVFVLSIIVLAILLGAGALNAPSFFTAGSLSANATQALQDNTTQIASNFSQRLPVAGTIFGVVFLLAILAILIFYAVRMKNLGTSSSAGGL